MKKSIFVFLAVLILLAAFIPAMAVETKKVGFCVWGLDNFMIPYLEELQNYFAELSNDEVRYEVFVYDAKGDMAEQSNQLDSMIVQKMDVIIMSLVQTSSADTIIERVVKAGIPLVLINREPLGENGDESYEGILNNKTVCYVGADARQSGIYQGEIVAELPDHGDINGDGKVSYLMIEGDQENSDSQYRTKYSVDTLAKVIDVECVDDRIGDWDQTKGYEITANALAQYGEKIEVIFCNNDAMALGAVAAAEGYGSKVGEDIYILGVDALEECQQMVLDGRLTGTVLNDSKAQSHAAVDAAVAFLKGEDVPNYIWVDYAKVTPEWIAEQKAAEAAEAAEK